jgi:hypothetical protein
MRRTLTTAAALAILCAAALAAQAQARGPWSLHARLDAFDFSVKAGAAFAFSDRFELSASVGACVISTTMITYALTCVTPLLGGDAGFCLDAEYGLIQASFDVMKPQPAWFWVPGACLAVGWRFPGGHRIALRAGAGAMFGWDLGTWQAFQAWPNLGIEYAWRLP